jgi:formyltetrahydrofolate deformylase
VSTPTGAGIGRLLISCPDGPGIISAISGLLAAHGANIVESAQHSTNPFNGTFFQRLEFHSDRLAEILLPLHVDLAALAERFSMRWRLTLAAQPKRLAIFVSRDDHVLQELLWRHRSGELPADIRMVISNHADLADVVAGWKIPFHHVPVSPGGKAEAEAQQLARLSGEVDLIVLARYMQILSPEFLSQFPNQVINIHHSFLPAFVGANPYRAAHDRGVKLIGATAHYATAELDAGPIIEQDVVRVDHRHTVAELRQMGRYVERTVLARAVTWHLQDRIIVHGNKTIVFA